MYAQLDWLNFRGCMNILIALFFFISSAAFAETSINDAYVAMQTKKPVVNLSDQSIKNALNMPGENPNLLKIAELIAYLPRPSLVKDFVEFAVKNPASANEDLSWGMAHLLIGQPIEFLDAIQSIKPQKTQDEIIARIGFGLSNISYDIKDPQSGNAAAIKKKLRQTHSKFFLPKNKYQKIMLKIEWSISDD